jgi:hypothetical protein
MDLKKMETRNYCDCNLLPMVLNIPTNIIMVPFNQSTYYNLPETIDQQGADLYIDLAENPEFISKFS